MQGTDRCPQTRRFGVFEVDLRAAELRKRGIRSKLQEQPFQILSLLLEHPGEIVTREELRQKLWLAHTFVDFDRSLNKAMTKLRSALGDSAESPRYVETIPRHGYRFLAPVHSHGEARGNQRPVSHRQTGSNGRAKEHSGAQSELDRSVFDSGTGFVRIGGKRLYGVAALLACVLLGAVAYSRMHQPVVLGGSMVTPRLSVAVLGFKNLSG